MLEQLGRSVVVVTGASSGMGMATPLAFARHGATVVLAARCEEPLRRLAGAWRREGAEGLALVVPTDATDAEAVAAMPGPPSSPSSTWTWG